MIRLQKQLLRFRLRRIEERAIERPDTASDPHSTQERLRGGWILLCLALSFLIYVAAIPRILLYSNPPTGDQPFYMMDAASIVQDHDLNLANNYANRDFDKFYRLAPHPPGFIGISAPYPLPPQLAVTTARPTTQEYSYHLPGLGIALVPAWIIGSWFSLWWPAVVVFMCLVGALLALNTFLFAYEVSGKVSIALAVWASMAFSGPLFSYSLLIFTELPCGLLLLYSFRRLTLGWECNGPLRRFLIGLCIAYIPWLAWRCLPISMGLLLYAVVQWSRTTLYRAQEGRAERKPFPSALKEMLPVVVPIVISACLLVIYSVYLFGEPIPSAVVAGQGPPVFHWPWHGGHELTLFVTGGFAIFFDQQWGLLPFTPVYLLAAVGIALMARSANPAFRRLLVWVTVVGGPYAMIIASFDIWGGSWCPPARYLTTLVPLLAAPLAISLMGQSRAHAAIYAFLSAIGFAFMWCMLRNPYVMFPMHHGYLLTWLASDPESPLHVNLLPLFPPFAWPDTGSQAFTTGRVVVLAFGLVVLCYGLVVRNTNVALATRRRFDFRFRPVVLSAATLCAGWLTMNYQYLQPQTSVIEQRRWSLTPAPVGAAGAAFWQGKLFVADYQGGNVDVLNVHTGVVNPLRVTVAGHIVPYFHPGDIAIGPDGLLYVLNNGPGNQALFVVRSTGELVRTESLTGKSPTSVGLAFVGNRGFYVTDMIDGAIRQYGLNGGNEVAAWTSAGKIFNNIAGIVTGPAGHVYVAESSANRILEFEFSGRLVRTYDLTCLPQQLAREGDWVDVACGTGLLSIDTRDHRVQLSHLAANDLPLNSPTGLAYGPGGLLFVVDGNVVVEYKIQH